MAGPLYPTDRPDGSTNDTTLSINNISDHREPKLQVGIATADVSEDTLAVTKANAVSHGDPIIFTDLGTVTGVAVGTIYYAHTITQSTTLGVTTTTFKIAETAALSVSNTAINLTGSDDDVLFYVNDGVLDGGESVGVTDLLSDLMGMTSAGTGTDDTMPENTAVAGISVLAQLVSEITQLYDALIPSRTGSLKTATSASGVFTKTAHGLVVGEPIQFTSAGSPTSGVSTADGIYTVRAIPTANTFTLTVVATGNAYSSSASGTGVKYYTPLSLAEQAYLGNLKALKLYYVQDAALKLSFELKRLNANINQISNTGALPDSMYPSGDQTWNY
jgi:hypothetical protein